MERKNVRRKLLKLQIKAWFYRYKALELPKYHLLLPNIIHSVQPDQVKVQQNNR